jgi:hypothetical protein
LAAGHSWAELAASPLLFKFVADDPGAVPVVQQVPWACLVVLYGFLYAVATFNADVPGLRCQVKWRLNTWRSGGLSVVLAPALGAPGPVLGSAVAVVVCQIVRSWSPRGSG